MTNPLPAPTAIARPSVARAVALITRHFLNRADLVAALDNSTNARPMPIRLTDVCGRSIATGTDPLEAVITSHLLGRSAPYIDAKWQWKGGAKLLYGPFRIGSYAPAEDNTTRWLCIDFDGKGHSDALRDALGEARKTLAAMAAAGIHGYLERSGGAAGYHLWIFFDPPVPATIAKRIGQWLVPRNALFADGTTVDPRGNKGIEVFPKQSQHRGTKATGNMVWLPWWGGAMPSGNLFYHDATDGRLDGSGRLDLDPYLPDEFAVLTDPDIARVVALIDAEEARTATERAVETKAQEDEATAARDSEDPTSGRSCDAEIKAEYDTWKRVAVAATHLDVPYGDILTGIVKSGGWLEARDPSSPSGDQHPSAGVADGSGEAKRGTFHSFRTGESLDIFDYLRKYKGHTNFMSTARYLAEVSGVPLPRPRLVGRSTSTSGTSGTPGTITSPRLPPDTRPEVNVANADLLAMTEATWAAVRAANARVPEHPRAFRANCTLVDLAPTDRGPTIRYMTQGDVLSLAVRAARYVREGEKATVPSIPPHDILIMMLNKPDATLPRLDEVITTPVFDQRGEIIAKPGYHPDAFVWYHKPDGFDLDGAGVSTHPSPEDTAAARALILDELLHDFPFASQSDCCHAVAAILLPFVRRLIAGNTPLHLLEAPAAGTGKGLLADTISMIAVGQPCAVGTISKNEEETQKQITAVLLRGAPVNLIDNVTELRSPTLAASITASVWSGRILGQSKMVELPNRALWLITGNNPSISQEIVRRCVRVRIDAKTDRPWKRTDFRHHPLLVWVAEHRAELVRAALVLVMSWIAAGRPLGAAKLGSFDEYAAVISGILGVIGVPGFLENSEELYESADDSTSTWREFLSTWVAEFGLRRFMSPREIREALCIKHALLLDVIGDKGERSQTSRLGRALSANRDRAFGGLFLKSRVGGGGRGGVREYAVVAAGSGNEEPDQGEMDFGGGAKTTTSATTSASPPSDEDEERRSPPVYGRRAGGGAGSESTPNPEHDYSPGGSKGEPCESPAGEGEAEVEDETYDHCQ